MSNAPGRWFVRVWTVAARVADALRRAGAPPIGSDTEGAE